MAWIFGLDVGKKRDYSALCLLEQVPRKAAGNQSVWGYRLHAIERLPQNTPYPEQVEHVRKRIAGSKQIQNAVLAIDQTGVGQPLVDYFRQVADLPVQIVPVEITGGMKHRWDEEQACFHVPKRSLVSTMMVMVEANPSRFDTPPNMKYKAVFLSELQNFKEKLTLAGNETFGAWRESDHDDLVLSVACGIWVGENTPIGWDGSLDMGMGGLVPEAVPAGVVLTDQRQDSEGVVLWEQPHSDMPGRWDEWKT